MARFDTIGHSHTPYRGKPAYLAEARPLQPLRADDSGPPRCDPPTPACTQQTRATLAALDGQLLALSTPPRDVELRAIQISLYELSGLMAGYPDALGEQAEMKQLLEKLPNQPAAEQAGTKKRMVELGDLMRLQLASEQ